MASTLVPTTMAIWATESQAAVAVLHDRLGPTLAHIFEPWAAEPAWRPNGTNGTNGTNVGMYPPRAVYGTLRPSTVDEVREILTVFDDPNVPCGLHPVSTGFNWGLGSREPAIGPVVTLDLRALGEIRTLDVDRGWAVIEPGVTQGRLAGLLEGTSRMLNVTAASSHTSVVGNVLDRGMGVRRQRVDDVAGLEVVLPGGELIHVGWWPEPHRATAVYPHGLGPSLLSLFTQSNLGVVTAAAVRLLPRPEARSVLRLSFGAECLADAIDEIRHWVYQGLVSGVVKVYDCVSAGFYGGRAGEFVAFVCVDGTARSVAASTAEIAEDAARTGLFSEVTRCDGPRDDTVVRMLEAAHAGDPSANDAMLAATLGQPPERVDEHGRGWLFFMPIVPFSGARIARAHELLDDLHTETGIRCGSTVNAVNADMIDFVVTIRFDRTPEDARRAHDALDRAYELFGAAGFVPYRLDVDHAAWIDRFSPDSGARELARRLKRWLDPNGAIAPGRYP